MLIKQLNVICPMHISLTFMTWRPFLYELMILILYFWKFISLFRSNLEYWKWSTPVTSVSWQ